MEKTLTKEDICRKYKTFEDLARALDSCYDLYDLGYCDEETQKQYEEMAGMGILEVFGYWRKAQGDADFKGYPFD
ncbi:hypothetical protein IMZ31_24005 (plasmid) [Pontibacillus sp. ALD_SL1]|uniref:hypothetical protein n=1 Tax=Pontibacillus sp. ALD_SL1 TaxID=2777185 RepID=UPI001A9761B5|nr:hypothetical protein [Pontibacillus sp. ALD_SL1]QST02517.1 hypothetical protein IMZ31_24005 [Pontibacillus sp. ALD_SL1]